MRKLNFKKKQKNNKQNRERIQDFLDLDAEFQ